MNYYLEESNNSNYHFLVNFDTPFTCFAMGIEFPIDLEAIALFFGFSLITYSFITIIFFGSSGF